MLSLVFALIFSTAHGQSASCARILNSFQEEGSPLPREAWPALKELAQLRIQIDLAQTRGDLIYKSLNDQYQIKWSQLTTSLDFSAAELYRLMQEEIEHLQFNQGLKAEEQIQQKENQTSTIHSRVSGTIAVFNPVAPGAFKRAHPNTNRNHSLSQITRPFALMSTPVTQIVWRKVVTLAELHFPGKYKLDPDPSFFKGDTLPVETVSYIEVQKWIAVLNKLSKKTSNELAGFIVDHKPGDLYRLPTNLEWEFVASDKGQNNTILSSPSGIAYLNSIAWHSGNSEDHTHPVGQKDPLLVEGYEYFDLFGNVKEWVDTHDLSQTQVANKKKSSKGKDLPMLGGSYRWDPQNIATHFTDSRPPAHAERHTGFRLAKDPR